MTELLSETIVTLAVLVATLRGVTLWKSATVTAAVGAAIFVGCCVAGTIEFGPIDIAGWRVGAMVVWYLLRDFAVGVGLGALLRRMFKSHGRRQDPRPSTGA